MAGQPSAGPTPWWKKDTTPGYLLLGATVLSFVLLNGPTHDAFYALLTMPVGVNLPGYVLEYDLKKFIKDALMCVFFLYVGLELKRECIEGPFRNLREAALPGLGAIGGMAAPAFVYLAVSGFLHPEGSTAYSHGWAIPAATDIAFAIGVLSLLGSRVHAGLRLFLLALAIADDLGAILVIAFFYSSAPNLAALGVSAVIVAAMFALNRFKVFALSPYWVLGLALWAAMAQSGVSPTLAGVLTALFIPMRRPDGRSPLIEAEHTLKPWVQLGVMPVFALAMAGVVLAGVTATELFHPVAVGIALGLFLGKPLGIVTMTWIGAKVLRQPMPCNLPQLVGVAMIAGIGFTMSLFVGALAFYGDPVMDAPVRFGVLGGSFLSAVTGLAVLAWALGRGPLPSAELAREEELAEDSGVLEDIDPPARKPAE